MRRIFAVALVAFSLAALAGCAATSFSQIKQFASASKALGGDTRSAFDLAATASADRNLYDVAADPTKGPDNSTFEVPFNGDVPGGKEKAERLALRLRVLDQLSNYSSALQELADADFDKDIDQAANNLNGSLIGLRNTFKSASSENLPLNDDDIGIIATAVNAIGKAVARDKQRAAIKITITKADPAVQKATALIAEDLGQDSDLADFVKQAIANSRGSVQEAYNLERLRPNSSFESRYSLLVRARHLYAAEANTPKLFAAVSRGAAAVGAAHSALASAVKANDFSSAEVAMRLGELEVYLESVRDFYTSIQETEH